MFAVPLIFPSPPPPPAGDVPGPARGRDVGQSGGRHGQHEYDASGATVGPAADGSCRGGLQGGSPGRAGRPEDRQAAAPLLGQVLAQVRLGRGEGGGAGASQRIAGESFKGVGIRLVGRSRHVI